MGDEGITQVVYTPRIAFTRRGCFIMSFKIMSILMLSLVAIAIADEESSARPSLDKMVVDSLETPKVAKTNPKKAKMHVKKAKTHVQNIGTIVSKIGNDIKKKTQENKKLRKSLAKLGVRASVISKKSTAKKAKK